VRRRIDLIEQGKYFPERGESSEQGFTIIEVLVAVALFAIVVLVILAPLTGLYGLTQKSGQQTSVTNVGQQVIEAIRGQWQNASRNQYDLNCAVGPLYSTSLSPAPVVNVTVQDENVQGDNMTNTRAFAVSTSTSCPASAGPGVTVAPGPPIRQITVVSTIGTVSTTLVLEVAR
jgi:prepilin-type N-terminal cleavage/methylation domain-containing protein